MRHTVLTLAIAGLVAAAGSPAWAQAEGEGPVDPIKELKEALEKMRSAEELLAQSSREAAAVEQSKVDPILRKLLDDIELKQDGAAQKMLRGAEKAAVGIDRHIERVLGSIQFKQGQGSSGQSMEMKQQPGEPRQEKAQQPTQLEKGQEPKPGEQSPQPQTGEKPGQQALDVYDAQGNGGRPAGRDVDPDAWYESMPPKFQEDALKERMETWPGRYDDLIREWHKALAKIANQK
jgi:hypothetical protein